MSKKCRVPPKLWSWAVAWQRRNSREPEIHHRRGLHIGGKHQHHQTGWPSAHTHHIALFPKQVRT